MEGHLVFDYFVGYFDFVVILIHFFCPSSLYADPHLLRVFSTIWVINFVFSLSLFRFIPSRVGILLKP